MFAHADDAGHVRLLLALSVIAESRLATPTAREHQESILRLWDEQRDRRFALLLGTDPKGGCLSHAGYTLWCLGYADQAVAMCKKAVVAADTDPNPFSKAAAQFFLNIVHILRQDARAVQDGAEWVIDFCTKHGLGLWPPFFAGASWMGLDSGGGGQLKLEIGAVGRRPRAPSAALLTDLLRGSSDRPVFSRRPARGRLGRRSIGPPRMSVTEDSARVVTFQRRGVYQTRAFEGYAKERAPYYLWEAAGEKSSILTLSAVPGGWRVTIALTLRQLEDCSLRPRFFPGSAVVHRGW